MNDPEKQKPDGELKKNIEAAVYCLILCLPALAWIILDNRVWPWDQSYYGTATLDLWFTLVNYPGEFLGFLLNSIGGSKVPGISLFGMLFLPLATIFSIDSCFLLSILVTAYFALLLTFKTSEALTKENRWLPYLTTLMLAGVPLFAYLTRVYLVEMQQLLPVVYMFWILSTFKNRDVPISFAHFMFATAISLFSKVSSPLYCLIPGIVLTVMFFKSGLKNIVPVKRQNLALWILSLFALILVSVWYLNNFDNALAAAQELSIGGIAENYGEKANFFIKLKTWLAIVANRMMITPVQWLFPIFLAVPIYKYATDKELFKNNFLTFNNNSLVASTALMQTALVLFVLANSIPEDSRYIFAAIPSLIFLFQTIVSGIKQKIYSFALIFMFASQFALVNLESFGSGTILGPGVERLTVSNQKKLSSEISSMVKITSGYYTNGYDIVIGASYPWINANTYSYYYLKEKFYGNVDKLRFETWDIHATEKEGLEYLDKKKKYIFITHERERLRKEKMLPHANLLNLRLYDEASKGQKLEFESEHDFELFKVNKDLVKQDLN